MQDSSITRSRVGRMPSSAEENQKRALPTTRPECRIRKSEIAVIQGTRVRKIVLPSRQRQAALSLSTDIHRRAIAPFKMVPRTSILDQTDRSPTATQLCIVLQLLHEPSSSANSIPTMTVQVQLQTGIVPRD